MADKNLELSEESKVQLDIKAIIGMIIGVISIAGVWFTLTAEMGQLQLDVIRMQDAVELNEEFRIKWSRGEMGALPDDAKQDLKIMYLQEEVKYLKDVVKQLEIDNAKKELVMAKQLGEDTKVTLDLKTIGMLLAGAVSLALMYFTLQADIALAKELPKPVIDRIEYDLKDELIRQTILDTQEDVEAIQEQLDKIDQRLYEMQRK